MKKVYANESIDKQHHKEWVLSCDPWRVLERNEIIKEIDIPHFQELSNIHFAYDDCYLSIPCMYDGLKPVYCKILFTLFKVKYPTKLRKVFAFVGEVIQVGKYMHGNASLSETIFGMTRYWAGSNNIPLLKGQGGIGTKLDLGSDIVKQDMLM